MDGYFANEAGEVRGPRKNLKLWRRPDGYITFSTRKYGTVYVHRAVADAFLEHEEGKDEVNHKNGDKSDNRLFNLERCTRSENMKHSVAIGTYPDRSGAKNQNAKLNQTHVDYIRSKIGLGYTCRELSEELGVSISQVSRIARGDRW